MSPIKEKKTRIGLFILKIVLLSLLAVLGIVAIVFWTRCGFSKSSRQYSFESMQSEAEIYARSICAALESSGEAAEEAEILKDLMESELFDGRILLLTDARGEIAAKSRKADFVQLGTNLFTYFQNAGYGEDCQESEIRQQLLDGISGAFSVTAAKNENVVFRSLGAEDYRLFFIQDQAEAEAPFAKSDESIRLLWIAGIVAAALILLAVISTVRFVLSYKKNSEEKLSQSSQAGRKIQKQAQSYSKMAELFSQNYIKAYCVDLSNDQYLEFIPAPDRFGKSRLNEGVSFSDTVCRWLVSYADERDREAVRAFLDRKALVDNARNEAANSLRMRMIINNKPVWCDLRTDLFEEDGQRNLVLVLKDVNESVIRDRANSEEKDTALRRVEAYRNALLHNMLGYAELDLSREVVADGPFAVGENNELRAISIARVRQIMSFRELLAHWSKRVIIEDDGKEFVMKNDCEYLRREYEKGNHLVEMDLSANWLDGSRREIRQSYYMAENRDGGITALCVLSDRTEEISREKEIVNLTEQLERSRVKISTGQMQPHFLYNVLGSIREIILEDPEYASNLICDFTTHLRACIKSLSNDDLIPFEKEIENIKAYVNIEQMRFGDRMQVDFDIKDIDFRVVPLSIQPLVENAIRHGLYPKREPGFVKITASMQNGYHVITVKDNGVGFDYEKITSEINDHQRDSAGITNLTLRLEKVLKAKVYFDSKIGVGTTVTVLIPEQNEEVK